MSKTVEITSAAHFQSLLSSSRVVVVDFYADWCAPCKAIAPLYEQLSGRLSRPSILTFTKVDSDKQAAISRNYNVSALPTFLIFKNGREVSRIQGADTAKLSDAVKKLAKEAESDGGEGGFGEASGSGGGCWIGAALPRGYKDVTGEVDVRGLDLLNADSEFGSARTLFETAKPSSLDSSKGKGKSSGKPDWVESDTDEQMMLFIPFNSTMKVHTIHLTSLPGPSADASDEDDDEVPMRPKTIKIFTNRTHNLGFEEAEDYPATQEVELKPEDWDEKTGTARLELRFVKFQNVTSLVLFIVDGDGDGERTRLDRVRIIGDSGEKREMGKLEKIGDES